jgi:hypothetical protein
MQTYLIVRKPVSSNISKFLVLPLIFLCAFQIQVLRADEVIYDDVLENGFQNWGWATLNYANTSPVHSGSDSVSVTITGAGYLGIQIVNPSGINDSGFSSITFWANGGSTGGQQLQIYGLYNGSGGATTATGSAVPLSPLPANSWTQYTVSLTSLSAANLANFTGFVVQDTTDGAQPTFYMDDISLVAGAVSNTPPVGTNALISIVVNANSNRLAISPLIYGVAFATSNQLSDLNFALNRSGGNNETRYNWVTNAHNLDFDYYFESYPDSSSTPGATADAFVQTSIAGGAQAAITVPMIGWAPKLGSGRSLLYSYAVTKYGAQTSVDPYQTNAGNGISLATGQPITNNDPNDANIPVDVGFEQGYVRHLMTNWGSSTNGGVKNYIMDNEHSIWFSTHQDIHPVGPTMQEIWGKMMTNAAMVKSNDPNAMVWGPEEWGWNGYFYSGYDQQWSGQRGDYNTADYPDRKANGGMDYLPWLLNQFHQYDLTNHQRLLDYFTVHCYPQEGSVGGSAIDIATELLRNQTTRQFWDSNYVDPSWINSKIYLIPRMKSWAATYYPGTKTGVTEYNWGAEAYINGGTAQADILGIFGRQGLDLSTRWTTPASGTPTYLAMKMYRNYDGNKSTFGDTSVLTAVPNPDDVSAFGALRSTDGAMTLMVINKDLTNASPFNAAITNFTASGAVQRWQLTGTAVITQLSSVNVTNGVLSDMLPQQSITLYVVPGTAGAGPFSLQRAAGANPPGQVNLQLNGQSGVKYILQSSTDLVHWAAFSTNTLSSNSYSFSIPTTGGNAKFVRGMLAP